MHLDNEAIRELRHDRGWTQQQLADACGISLRTVQRLEKEGVASLDTTAALTAVFEVERSRLLRVSPPESAGQQIQWQTVVISGAAGLLIGVAMTLGFLA